jgi:hypothetical protein
MRDLLKDDWDIQIDDIKDSEEAVAIGKGIEPSLEGYDIYIFEHHMPQYLPTDGVVILIDPDTLPKDMDLTLGERRGFSNLSMLEKDETHPIMDNIDASKIGITRYRKISSFDGSYTPILSVDDAPVAIVKNEPLSKIMVLTLDLHYSDFAITPEFPMFIYNIINYYAPTTFEDDVVEIYDKVTLTSRSEKLSVTYPGDAENISFTEFPVEIEAFVPGIYTVVQMPVSGQQIVENFFVTIPTDQCNIVREVDFLTNPYYPPVEEADDVDFVFYFALALVCLAFAEWGLKSREYT